MEMRQEERYEMLTDREHQRLVTQVDGITMQLNQTAIILERLNVKLDDHGRRINALEAQPERTHASMTSDRAQIMMFVSLLISGIALLFTAATHLTFH